MPAIKTGSAKGRKGKFDNTPLPIDSDYIFEIANVAKTLSPKGKPRLSFRFKVVGGGPIVEKEDGERVPEALGRSIFEDAYLTDDAMWKIEAIAEAAGVPEGTEFDPDDAVSLLNTFKGRKLRASVIANDYVNRDGATVEGRRVTNFASLDGKPAGSGAPSGDDGEAADPN